MRRDFHFTIIALMVSATVQAVEAPPAGRAAGAMPNDAYIWQRVWIEAVSEAVMEHGGEFTELIVLQAEVTWRNRTPQVVRVQLAPSVLQNAGGRIGLALRIGSYAGPFEAKDAPARFLTELAASLVSEAVTNRLCVAELQIDFDCAESKLDGYAVWVEAIRRRVAPVPVTITALPAWLKQAACKRLITAADGYVLQVHSLERPTRFDAAFKLCDPAEARSAVERAAGFGKPFRVALPTYGYVIAFDQAGRFAGLSAEGPARIWAEGTQLREVRSEPAAMAQLVQSWQRDRPQALAGVIWYRLPISQDRLNWRWPTLSAVMSGTLPRSDLRAEARHPKPGLVEIDLVNAGATDSPAPSEVILRWTQGRVLAADGLQCFDSVEPGPNTMQFQSKTDTPRLEAGERRNIGWIRLTKETEVQIEISESKN